MDELLAEVKALREENATRHEAVLAAIADVRSYIEKIENDANEMMAGMTSPDAMLNMAGKFLGQS